MPSTNQAAYLYAVGQDVEVKPAPYYSPHADQVTIRNYAVALNPADSILQKQGLFISDWPHILGLDSAGIVEEAGSNVTHVKKGDRVFAVPLGRFGSSGFADNKGFGGFQMYSLCDSVYVGKLPDDIAFAEGCVFPLTTMTSTIGLFAKMQGRKFLGLDRPSLKAEKKDGFVLIWGGSSSVEMCAIQLAVAAGYSVITTCSPKNFEVVKELGVDEVFDRGDEKCEDKIVQWLQEKALVGTLDAISRYGTIERCTRVVQQAPGSRRAVFVDPAGMKGLPTDIETDVVFGDFDEETWDLLRYIYHDFLPSALQTGAFKAARPQPEIVGHGLEKVQNALNAMSGGADAKKFVVTL